MNRARALIPVVVVLAALSVAGLVRGTETAVSVDQLSAYDLEQLGFDLAPVSAADRVPSVDAGQAVAKASERLGVIGGSPEVVLAAARPRPAEPRQVVWLVVYRGGAVDDIPWGPFIDDGRPPAIEPAFSGVLVDAESGDVLVAFHGGTQPVD